MEALICIPTEYTPNINFNPQTGEFIISGESRPENASKFFTPVIEWMEQFKLEVAKKSGVSQRINITFGFSYFNSTSAKFILDMLKSLDAIKMAGATVHCVWQYDEQDEDMHDSGEEFEKLANIKFEFVKI